MCGLFGCLAPGGLPDVQILQRASNRVQYRGQDESGNFSDGTLYLSHHRLSIIDLNTGSQPMRDASGRYLIAFNGELFNYIELKRELGGRWEFQTQSDTEVFLAGVVLEGERFLRKARGMFAAAIWDSEQKRLTLARDLLGKKPLYVMESNGKLFFSSSLHSFQELPGWKAETNPAAVAFFAHMGFIPSPLCIYRGIRKLWPGSMEVHDLNGNKRRSVFRRLGFSKGRARCSKEEFEESLAEALSVRFRSDVPVGMTFSGGVDSGLLAAMAKEKGLNPQLYNIDYEDESEKSPERRNARLAASRLNLNMTEYDFRPEEMFGRLPEAYRHFDEPCAQLPLVYNRSILNLIAKAGIKVVITGNGADEVFFGYRGSPSIRRQNLLLQTAVRFLPSLALPSSARELKEKGWNKMIMDREVNRITEHGATLGFQKNEVLEGMEEYLEWMRQDLEHAEVDNFVDYCTWRNMRYNGASSNYLLPDINGMHEQVEVRAPFLDEDLLDKAIALPVRSKIGSFHSDRENKSLLKRMYAQRAGADLAYDAKRGMGWNIRFDRWIVGEEKLIRLFKQSYQRLSDFQISPEWFEKNYEKSLQSDFFNAPGAPESIMGFMLAAWLIREHDGEERLQEYVEPVSKLKLEGKYSTQDKKWN